MLPVGSPAVGKDFINRERETALIIDALKRDSILLVAPRKYGKTSVMKRIQALIREREGVSIFIDVHDVYTPQEFVVELATGAYDLVKNKKLFVERLKRLFSNQLRNLEFEVALWELKVKFKKSLREEIEKSDWKEEGRTVFTFIRHYFDNPVYIIIDEFSECLNNMAKKDAENAEVFCKWFRSVRAREESLRFMVGGSVSIDRVVRMVTSLSAINDFRRLILKGFDREPALYTIEKVFEEEGWVYTDGIGDKIIECIRVPTIPYFLSCFLSIIQGESIKNLDEHLIEELYNNSLMGASGKHYFDYFVQRLNTYSEEKAARALLKAIGQNGSISMDKAFDIFGSVTNKDHETFLNLVSDLENDFYVRQKRDLIEFFPTPLADWWRLYHV